MFFLPQNHFSSMGQVLPLNIKYLSLGVKFLFSTPDSHFFFFPSFIQYKVTLI